MMVIVKIMVSCINLDAQETLEITISLGKTMKGIRYWY